MKRSREFEHSRECVRESDTTEFKSDSERSRVPQRTCMSENTDSLRSHIHTHTHTHACSQRKHHFTQQTIEMNNERDAFAEKSAQRGVRIRTETVAERSSGANGLDTRVGERAPQCARARMCPQHCAPDAAFGLPMQ
jgi:hypothetical protein